MPHGLPRRHADELSPQHGDRMTGEANPIPHHTAMDDAAALRSLISDEFVSPEHGGPIRRKGTVGRTGDRVLVDPGARGEESRDEVAGLVIGPCGDPLRPARRAA